MKVKGGIPSGVPPLTFLQAGPGAGLWLFLALRPDLACPSAGVLPVALGFGVVLAVAGIGLNWTPPDLGGDSLLKASGPAPFVKAWPGVSAGLGRRGETALAERLLPDGSIGCVVYMP